MQDSNTSLEKLLATVSQLRDEKGCPWDKKQTSLSLIKYIREETEELIKAIQNDDQDNICEESGDILFLLVILARIHQENNIYDFSDVMSSITEKLIRRHPHVFGDSTLSDESALRKQWQAIKRQEKAKKK